MVKMKVLWVDSRNIGCFEGQLMDLKGQKYYFNYSVSLGRYLPQRGQECEVELGKDNKVNFVKFN